MKQKDILVLVPVSIVAAVLSMIISGAIFNSSGARSVKVPVVMPITGTFPDIQNDSQYKAFFNSKALDPTQLIKIGPSHNQQPFSSSQ